MTTQNHTYENALAKIMAEGVDRGDRTGTGTRSLFGLQMRWHLAEGFPLVTTKQVYTRPMVEELLWMLSGSTDNNVLADKNVREKDFDVDGFLNVLEPYYKNGEYGYLLNSDKELDLLNKRFIVFELDVVKDNPVLFPVVTIIIMETFINKMRRLQGIRKMILIEEA